ncbi:hypothetical protein [Tenacibaculum maritimum]|uniref:hypothetical protein n=1 Tax=Tenacibaculum maritimum TaxID=107401 RepID=UPI0038910848
MHKVNIEGASFLYDDKFEYYNKNIILSQDAIDFLDINQLKKTVRPILTEHYSNDKLYFLDYLYWFKTKLNLDDLDCKILSNLYTKEDFKFSIKTRYVNELICSSCGSKHKSLVVDPVLIYPGNFNLGNEKRKLIEGLNLKCPKCDSDLTQFVIHIFN